MYKYLLCTLALLMVFALPLNVSAAEEVTFSLTDVSCEKNRLFETTLCVSGKVAAFVAELTFDENAVAFRSASAVSDDAQLSVNSNESGKIKVAFLCKNGVNGEVINFTFKSTSESSHIDLSVEQVIDSSSNDLAVKSLTGAEITVGTKETIVNTESTDQPTEAESTYVGSNHIELAQNDSLNTSTLVIYIAGGVVLLFGVAAAAFFIGRNSRRK